MAVNKEKLIASAQRLTQKGQIDRAIREYRTIVEDDPTDVRIWMKIGALYVRKGAIPHAIATYNRVANHYREEGHAQKAVAVYKQIISLAPGAIDAHLVLGNLYARLNQPQEAISELQIVVGAYEREGRHQESCDLLQQIVELQPDDEPNRIRLAEAYARQGQTGHAADEFRIVLDQLLARGRVEDYIQVAERMLYLAPDQHAAARKLAEIYLQRAQPKRALARLQVLFQANPTDPDVLRMLGQAFRDLGYGSKAASVYRELARLEGLAGNERGRHEALRAVLALEPDDEEAMAALGMPAEVDVMPRVVVTSGVPRPVEPPAPKGRADDLLRDVDLYIKYELFDHALARLDKVFAVDPDSVPALERRAKLLMDRKREREALVVYLRLADLTSGEKAMDFLGRVLQIDPDHIDARARLRGLSDDMAADQGEAPVIMASPEPYEVELDLDGFDFDDDLNMELGLPPADAGDHLDFELDLDELAPAPDDDAFSDLLDQAARAAGKGERVPTRPVDEGLQLGRQAFGDLDAEGDDFGDLLAPEPASGGRRDLGDFGDLLQETSVDPLAAALVPDAPALPTRPSHGPPSMEEEDEFGDLLSGAPSLQDDSFGDLLAPDPRAPAASDAFGDLLAHAPRSAGPAPLDFDAAALGDGTFGDDAFEDEVFGEAEPASDLRFDEVAFGDLLPPAEEPALFDEEAASAVPTSFEAASAVPAFFEDDPLSAAPAFFDLAPPAAQVPDDDAFADLLADPPPAPVAEEAYDLDLDALAFGGGEDTGLDLPTADVLGMPDEADQFDAEVAVGALPGVMGEDEDDADGLEAFQLEDDDLFLEADEALEDQRSLLAPPPPPPPPPSSRMPPLPRLPNPAGGNLRDKLARITHRSGPVAPAPPPPPGGSLFNLRTETPAPMPAEPEEPLSDDVDLSGAEFFNIGGTVEWPALTAELAELDFLLGGRLVAEARELLSELNQQHPGHPELTERLDRILEIETDEELVRQAEAQTDALLDAFDGDVDFGTVQGSMISELAEDDGATHLDLGLAFRQMGQFNKAIGQLEKARRGRELFAEATRVLALVHVERGQPQQAVDLLVEALADARVKAHARVALRYELAGAYEATGRRDRAADELRAVASASNPDDFPDLPERLARLAQG
ncbi:MAG: tetratricopeptide repeat protein [Myxococcales bacterium]|nr:tetratricopeptide repeat protein [Myxococcales bacterium]